MNFFRRAWKDSYDELITFYPRFYRDVLEMEAILRAHGDYTNEMMDDIEQTFLNGFIDYASEAQIERWENFLHISLNRSLTLDDRRRAVKAYIIGFGKMSASVIKAMVNAYLGISDTEVDFRPRDEDGNNAVLIYIYENDDITANFQQLRVLLRRKIPAHLWYWYRQVINYEMRFDELIDMYLAGVRFKYEMDFWETKRHNGLYYLDGGFLHNNSRRYDIRVYTGTAAQLFTPEEIIASVAFLTGIKTSEEIRQKERHKIIIDFWGVDLLDGRFLQDGTHGHHNVRWEGRLSAGHKAIVDETEDETLGKIRVLTRTGDVHFHDGTWLLDGSVKHKTIYDYEEEETAI